MSLVSERWSLRDGIYRDGALETAGVVHGVTTKALGDMKAAAARREGLKRAGLPQREPHTLRQVHGKTVHLVPTPALRATPPASGRGEAKAASPPVHGRGLGVGGDGDALISNTPGAVLAVWVADCLPVFLWDPRNKAVGLAHSGWRGTKAGVASETLKAMQREFGTRPQDVVAAVGPHVRSCCYVVSPDTAALFPEAARVATPKGPALDLGLAVRLQLEGAGVSAVAVSGACTASSPETLFSFRRDKADARMMAFIACP